MEVPQLVVGRIERLDSGQQLVARCLALDRFAEGDPARMEKMVALAPIVRVVCMTRGRGGSLRLSPCETFIHDIPPASTGAR